MERRPNIVLFVPDSYRGDVLAHQGNPAALTPNLDRIVEGDAVSYSRAFAQNPVCTPSRCSFMTGWYPHVHGHRSMRNMLKEHEPSLLSVFRREGYYTWWSGKNDLVAVGEKGDYLKYCEGKFDDKAARERGAYADEMPWRMPPPVSPDDPRSGAFYRGVMTRDDEGEPHYDTDTARVLAAVDMIRERPDDRPFFCFLPLNIPHPAYLARQDLHDAIDPDLLPPRIPLPGEGANLPPVLDAMRAAYHSDEITDDMWREVKRIYYAMCAEVDALFGKVIDALIDEGIYDDTWVLFFSDHGDFTGDYGLPEKTHATLQDSLVRVPLVVKPPKGVPLKPGKRDSLVELVDVSATLYDMLGIEPGYDTQGRSLRDSLAGDETALRDAVFAEVGGRRGEEAFVNKEVNQRPPDSFYGRQGRAAISHHLAGSHAVMCRTDRYKYVRRVYTGHHELFDLEVDPDEMQNLSGHPEVAEVEAEMRERLLDFMLRTADVLPHEHDSRKV